MADVVGSAEFELRASRQQMKKDLEEAKRDLGGFVNEAEREVGGSTSRVSGMMGKLGLAVGALSAIIVAGIALAVKFGGASLEMADTLANSARRIGIGTEALQEWQYAARKTGEDAGAVSGALETFSSNAAQAAAGLNKGAKDAFHALGFEPEDLRKFKDTEVLLDAVTDRIGELKNEADRAAISEKLGLGPLATALREGSDEVARLRDEARELGFVMDDALIQKGAQAQGQMEDLSQVIGIQMAEAFIGLSDEVLAFTGHIADAVRGLNSFIERFEVYRNRATALYGDEVVSDTIAGNSGQALLGAIKSVFSGRTRNATQVINNGGDLGGAVPTLAAMQGFARPPADDRPRDLSGRSNLTPVQPRGRVDNSAEKARRAAEQEARRAERVETEINRARIRVLGIVDREAQTVQERFDTAQAQVEAERAAEATQLESRLARKDITKAEFDQLTLINTQTVTLEDRVAKDILGRDLADERLAKERLLSDLTGDLLALQSSAARTAGERRSIEQTLLAQAQKQAREDLETRLARTPGLSDAEKDQARATLNGVQTAQRDALNRQNMTPLEAWRDQSLKSIAEVNEAYEGIAARGLDALNDGIVDAIMNSKNLGDVFSSVAKGILADLLAISVRRSITEPLGRILFGGGKEEGGGITSAIGSFLKGKIPGFSSGVTNFGGGLARVHAGELLVNLPQGTDVITAAASRGMAAGASSSRQSVIKIEMTEGAMFEPRVTQIAGPMVEIGKAQAIRTSSEAAVRGAPARQQALRRLGT